MKALRLVAGFIVLTAASRLLLAQEAVATPLALNPEEGYAQNQSASADVPTKAQDGTGQASTRSNEAQDPHEASPDSTLENTVDAAESDDGPRRQLVHFNEYHGPYFTIRVGGGFLYEADAYSQDSESKQQFSMSPAFKVRDSRLLFRGRFPQFDRSVTWCAGFMYDGPTGKWFVRQTGVMIAVPELWGNFFIGRAKEGFSLNKVMAGYDGWTMERSTMNDATVPLLADGIKWLGYSPKHGFSWNLGYFNDIMSKGQSFSSYSSQEVARLIWLPIHSEETRTLFHIGANLRYGKPVDDKLRLKSRPESFPAPFFLDTGTFDATASRMAGPEVYYRKGSWLFGSEYWWEKVSSQSKGDPVFHGGDVVVTWLATGETRPYNTVGGYFLDIDPKRPVFKGGPGAWEFVFRLSHTDLNSGPVQGGRFVRFTPMANWYLSEHVRLEMAYGYGRLNRFDLKGNTQFFQTRIQFQL
ncbi:MAG TPA: porin [Terriglobales bacterium]|nr:porin [Terriglobales bacterium]